MRRNQFQFCKQVYFDSNVINLKILFMKNVLLFSLVFYTHMVFAGTVTTKIELGRKSKDCNGLGICNTESTNGLIECKLLFTQEINQMTFTFGSDFIENVSELIAANCRKEQFVLDEDYIFTKIQSEKLGSSKLIVLPKGSYIIVSKNNVWVLTFDKLKFID